MLITFRFSIPISCDFHTNDICIREWKFTWFKYLTICGVLLLLCHSVWNKFDNIIDNYCGICYTDGTILSCLYKQCHITTNDIKEKIMNIIKRFNGFILIGKVDDVTVVVGSQHRPICASHNRLSVRLFSVWYIRGPEIVQHGDICHTWIGYSAYYTGDIYQFRV